MPEKSPGNPMLPDYLAQTDLPSQSPEADRSLAMRMLYDEQNRLRTELDQMRQKQEQQGKEGDKKEGEHQKQGEEGDEGKEKQPPLKERARSWIRQHPVATILIVIGFVLLVIACILLWNYLDSYTDTDDAFIDGHTDPISARINGFVAAVYVENTYHVKKGQLLAQLDDRDNLVAKEQASANYAQAQAGVRAQAPNVPITDINESTQVINSDFDITNAEASVAAAEERHRSALADLRQAEVNQANTDREEKRYKLLVDKEEVSREQYDQRATEARAQAQVVASRNEMAGAAEKSVKQAEAQLGTARQRNAQAKRNLPNQLVIQRETLQQRLANENAAKAQSDQSELNLEYTRIYAPEDGIIGDKEVQVGAQVAPGQELFALTQTNDIWVTANFKETQIERMHAGQSVTVHVDAIALDFDGYVEALPGASGAIYSLLPPENATGNYVKVVQRLPVRIRIKPGQNGAERLAPGMSVEPKVWLR
jgi:membrane fusion protein (multidrug efflux system)